MRKHLNGRRKRLFDFGFVIVAGIVAGGCNNGPAGLNAETVKALLEAKPVKIEAEQVVLTPLQVECGEKEDLWNQVQQKFGERTVARLNQKAKDLKFDDEVTVNEPGYAKPYAQVRGDLPVQVAEVVNISGDVAEVKAGVVMQHACLTGTPLPLMGVKRGKFTQEVNPRFQFSQDGETWKLEKILH